MQRDQLFRDSHTDNLLLPSANSIGSGRPADGDGIFFDVDPNRGSLPKYARYAQESVLRRQGHRAN